MYNILCIRILLFKKKQHQIHCIIQNRCIHLTLHIFNTWLFNHINIINQEINYYFLTHENSPKFTISKLTFQKYLNRENYHNKYKQINHKIALKKISFHMKTLCNLLNNSFSIKCKIFGWHILTYLAWKVYYNVRLKRNVLKIT